MHMRARLIWGLAVVFLISGCSDAFRRQIMISNLKPMMDKMNTATNQNGDVETVRRAMPAALLQLDGFIEAAPDNGDLLLRAAEAYSGYAFLFVEDVNKPRAVKLYKKARDYALRALQQNSALADILHCSNDDFNKGLAELGPDDARALFFSTSAWLSYMGLGWKYDASIVKHRPKLLSMMQRMLELDEAFNYGAIHAMYGSYYSACPTHLGGDPELSKYHFEMAFTVSESKFLPWRYLYAKYYCVQTQNRKAFVHTLYDIINAPVDLMPERRFANEAVKQKAKRLLEKADILFEKDGAYLKTHLYL